MEGEARATVETIAAGILLVRGQRVILDSDVARLYGVKTERLNEQVRRNSGRFPPDFMFRLTTAEWDRMYPQIAGTSRRSTRRRDRLPLAFTEHGCLMLSNLLRSVHAVEVSVLIVRAFVQMRATLAANAELAARVAELERELARQGDRLLTHDGAILSLLEKIKQLTRFPVASPRQIGFTADWKD